MNTFKKSYRLIFAALLFVMTVGIANACPNCKEAFSSESSTSQETMGGGTSGKGVSKVKQASVGNSYSVSILLMLGMPMAVVGGIGYIIYSQAQRGKKLQLETAIQSH